MSFSILSKKERNTRCGILLFPSSLCASACVFSFINSLFASSNKIALATSKSVTRSFPTSYSGFIALHYMSTIPPLLAKGRRHSPRAGLPYEGVSRFASVFPFVWLYCPWQSGRLVSESGRFKLLGRKRELPNMPKRAIFKFNLFSMNNSLTDEDYIVEELLSYTAVLDQSTLEMKILTKICWMNIWLLWMRNIL